MGWKHFPLLSKGFPYDFPCQIIHWKLYSECHDSPGLLWRRWRLKGCGISAISCHNWLRTNTISCKAQFNYSSSPSSSILNWKRWKGKGEHSTSHPDLTTAVRDRFVLRGLVLQLEELWHSLVGIRPWPFPFQWKQRMQTCSLLHKYSKCYCGVIFNRIFFPSFFFFFPPVARNCKCSGKEGGL